MHGDISVQYNVNVEEQESKVRCIGVECGLNPSCPKM